MVDLPPINKAKHDQLSAQETKLIAHYRQLTDAQRAFISEATEALARHGGGDQGRTSAP